MLTRSCRCNAERQAARRSPATAAGTGLLPRPPGIAPISSASCTGAPSANDAIVSSASLMVGVAAAVRAWAPSESRHCGLVAVANARRKARLDPPMVPAGPEAVGLTARRATRPPRPVRRERWIVQSGPWLVARPRCSARFDQPNPLPLCPMPMARKERSPTRCISCSVMPGPCLRTSGQCDSSTGTVIRDSTVGVAPPNRR